MSERQGVARLGLGTAAFERGYGLGHDDGSEDPHERETLLREAFEGGISYVDTSLHYGDAEQRLGRLNRLVRERGIRVCTKFTAAERATALPASLARLGVDRVDTILLHSAGGRELPAADVEGWMTAVKSTGVACRTGASTYGADAARLALALPWVDTVQVEHSILNPSVVFAIRSARKPGQEIVVRSVLCKGLLTARRRSVQGISSAVGASLDRLDALGRAWGFGSLPELAIRFALDTPDVDVVLVGVAVRDELGTAFAAAAHPPLTHGQLAALAEFDHSDDPWVHPERWELVR